MKRKFTMKKWKLSEVQKSTFYKLPKFLFEIEDLSHSAMILYSLLIERHELSMKNNWVDDKGYVYLKFSRENMGELLSRSKKTVLKAVNNLKKHDLLEEIRQGQGNCNLIYLKAVDYENNGLEQKCKNYTSKGREFTLQKVENFHPSNKNYSNTKKNKNILSSKNSTSDFSSKNSMQKNQNDKKQLSKKENQQIKEIVDYLNKKVEKNYKANTKLTIELIKERIEEDYTVEDFKKVIDIKCDEWLATKQERYLRPSTLFGKRFDEYLNTKTHENNVHQNWKKGNNSHEFEQRKHTEDEIQDLYYNPIN